MLRKNPLVDIIEKINMVMNLAQLTEDLPGGKKKGTGQQKGQNRQIRQLIEGLLKDLTTQNSVEVVGEILDAPDIHAVLSSRIDYFMDQNDSEIIDGEFKVLGKVVRVIKADSEDSINLLRKTSFGVLDAQLLEEFAKSLDNAENVGLKIPEMISEIKEPAIQVIPISIFT